MDHCWPHSRTHTPHGSRSAGKIHRETGNVLGRGSAFRSATPLERQPPAGGGRLQLHAVKRLAPRASEVSSRNARHRPDPWVEEGWAASFCLSSAVRWSGERSISTKLIGLHRRRTEPANDA